MSENSSKAGSSLGQTRFRPIGNPAHAELLVSLGSRAPFEYSDAGGGATDGQFIVKGVRVTT